MGRINYKIDKWIAAAAAKVLIGFYWWRINKELRRIARIFPHQDKIAKAMKRIHKARSQQFKINALNSFIRDMRATQPPKEERQK